MNDVIVLELNTEKKTNKSQPRVTNATSFTVNQLDDLQSKLMLVAGQAHQGKDDISRFVEVSVNDNVI